MSDRSTHEQDADMIGTSAAATPVDLSAIVKAYDVRGTAGEQLTVPVARVPEPRPPRSARERASPRSRTSSTERG